MVFNDVIAVRRDAYSAGETFPTASESSKRLITNAKKTPERGWFAEASAVILQQALRDADRAYRSCFESLVGRVCSVGVPRYKSRRERRQAVRFINKAGWLVTAGGRLWLSKGRG